MLLRLLMLLVFPLLGLMPELSSPWEDEHPSSGDVFVKIFLLCFVSSHNVFKNGALEDLNKMHQKGI